MKRSLSIRRSSKVANQGSSKRQKTNSAHYSTRDIKWQEQKALGGDFEAVGEGSWPISGIVDERGSGKAHRYRVNWRRHPTTLEEFEPTWLHPTDVNDEDISAWEEFKRQDKTSQVQQQLRSTVVTESAFATSADQGQQSNAASPPGLQSGSSDSELEIPETQYPIRSVVRVLVPPLPEDENKAEYASLESTRLDLSSPISYIVVTSSQSHANPSTQPSIVRKSPRISIASPVDSIATSSPQPWRYRLATRLSRIVPSSTDSVPSILDSQLTLPTWQQSLQQPNPESPTTSIPLRSSHLGSPFRQTTPIAHPLQHDIESIVVQSPSLTEAHCQTGIKDLCDTDEVLHSHIGGGNTKFASASHPSDLPNLDTPPRSMASRAMEVLDTNDIHTKSPLSQAMSIDELAQDPPLFADNNHSMVPASSFAGTVPLPIQESIEEDSHVAESSNALDSRLNSSQESLNVEREIETIDGVMIPALPILGPFEYAIALPAEGKIKSAYDEVIKLKRKSILRFIGRKGSPGTAGISNKKTLERIEMQDLLQRLCDTTTHADLGLPSTQHYEMNQDQNAAYAEYAGSKFTMLGHLIDELRDASSDGKACAIAVFAQPGALLDLLEEFLNMKKVTVRHHVPTTQDHLNQVDSGISVDLLPTQSGTVFHLPARPAFVLAFDITFSTSDSQVVTLRQQHGADIPIIHFLVTNSAEHVERCVPASLTSNIRLKVVVRTTFLAAPNLGGDLTLYEDPSDHPPDGRPMDMSELQRAVRKSPARRMRLESKIVASLALHGDLNQEWNLDGMPELKLATLFTPPKSSRAASRTPQPRRTRTQTPASRATTPVARKRLLDLDMDNSAKRLRLTPVNDGETSKPAPNTEELQEVHRKIAQKDSEISALRFALDEAEAKLLTAESKVEEWQGDHGRLLHRYEKSRDVQRELHKANKKLLANLASMQEKDEKLRTEQGKMRQQLSDVKAELSQARTDMISAGGALGQLELARQQAREATAKIASTERSLKSTAQDFEFTRAQYQDASKQAVDLAAEVRSLEKEIETLKVAASDVQRSMKAMNYETSLQMHMDRAEMFSLEAKSRNSHIKKLNDEISALKGRRGVQTRGSSVQPASSPAPRSRQASPAQGSHLVPPSGSRTSVLRNER